MHMPYDLHWYQLQADAILHQLSLADDGTRDEDYQFLYRKIYTTVLRMEDISNRMELFNYWNRQIYDGKVLKMLHEFGVRI